MRKWTITLLAAILLSALAIGAAAHDPKKNTGDAEQQIKNLEQQARQAAVKGDTSFLEKNLAEDYVGISVNGQIMDKQQAIQARKTGQIKLESIEPRDEKIRIFGNTAVVHGDYMVKGTRDGQDMSGENRVTRVWVKQGGQWKQVSFQVTPVRTTASASSK